MAWVEIAQVEADGETRFRYELRLPGNSDRIIGTSPPIRDADEFVSGLFREVQQLWFDNSDKPAKYLADLQDLGSSLFEQLFPHDLQAVLWKNRDNLDNLFLIADEPYFPWELVHLKPPVGGLQGRTQRFLGQYGLVRWQFLPFPPKPELQKRRGRVFSVCPDYVDPKLRLDEIAVEAGFLTENLDAAAVRASEAKVRAALAQSRGGHSALQRPRRRSPLDVADAKILLRGRKVGTSFAEESISATTVAERGRLARKAGPARW